MKILVCNAGSTSLKFKLFFMPEARVLATGKVERVGSDRAIFDYRSEGAHIHEENLSIPDYTSGIQRFLDALTDEHTGVTLLSEIEAVGFKTVLSKDHFGVHELTDEVLEGMRAFFSVAPAHNGPYLEAIRVFRELLPEVRLVGVFETAFHQSIPRERRVFPIPYEWTEKYGIQRMGYHGASHGYAAMKFPQYRRLINCHLGGSASLCAILDGRSVDTSFGFSLQMGIPNASRTGDVDVYLVPFLLEQGLTLDEIYTGFGKNGGLKGISGTSGDMRDIEEAIEDGSDRARLALDVYVTHILRYIGAYAMELGGLDAVTFTAGIGENSPRVRAMVLEKMAHMGVKIDREANENGTGERRITTEDSAIAAYVLPADEERMVVEQTYRLLKSQRGDAQQ